MDAGINCVSISTRNCGHGLNCAVALEAFALSYPTHYLGFIISTVHYHIHRYMYIYLTLYLSFFSFINTLTAKRKDLSNVIACLRCSKMLLDVIRFLVLVFYFAIAMIKHTVIQVCFIGVYYVDVLRGTIRDSVKCS